MKYALAFALGAVPLTSASDAAVTPVQKVLQLLEGMLAKGKEEKQAEEVQFAAYDQFCGDTKVEKAQAIADANEAIEGLNADIEKYTADAARLTQEIAKHEEDISTWNGDAKAATKVRGTEKATYDTTHKDYSESVDALERAIAVVKKQAHDVPQSLVQVTQLALIPKESKEAIEAFLDLDHGFNLGSGAPEADAYEFQSAGIVEMLEKLLDKFIAERTTLEKEEMNSKQAYKMLYGDLLAQIEQATAEKEAKAAVKATKLEKKARAEGDLADTTATRDADQKYLDDITATCAQKSSDFASRQTLRGEEIEAISKAIEIISSGAVAGAADKHLPALVQKTSLAQLRASSAELANQAKVAKFLQSQAGKLHSKVLATMATQVASSDDPFRKVKKMIKDLIVRLMEEANEEAEHKGWCDTELTQNDQTRKEKTAAVETLTSEIDELEAQIAKLTEDMAVLSEAVTALTAAMSKATTLRQEEKATNQATIQDAKEAQTAVAQALTVLKEFYEKAGEATALVQQKAPEIFDSSFKGQQGENGGVVGMLEVIQSDFARLEADTKSSEETSQNEYDTFMTDSTVDKDKKDTDIKHKKAKKQDANKALTMAKTDLEGNQKELDAAMAYFDKLKPDCVDMGVDFNDRVARRKEEIESLQEALTILAGDSI